MKIIGSNTNTLTTTGIPMTKEFESPAMKLILCEDCKDVVALSLEPRVCRCAKSGGLYHEDGDRITVSGPCRVYGVDNRLFTAGRAEAFQYPEDNGKVTRA